MASSVSPLAEAEREKLITHVGPAVQSGLVPMLPMPWPSDDEGTGARRRWL